jgi:hypothetical protein
LKSIFVIFILNLNFLTFAADSSTVTNSKLDADGDEIIVLDAKNRNRKVKGIEVKPNHIYDSEVEIKKFKEEVEKVQPDKNAQKYETYIVQVGDSLESISQILFKNKNKVTELVKLNFGIDVKNTKNISLKPGMKLKYRLEQIGTKNDNKTINQSKR